MTKKKDVPPTESLGAETVNPAPEAPETPPASSDLPQAPEPGPAPPATPETPSGPDGFTAIVTADNGLNFRAGPGFDFDVLGVVEFGTLLIILDLPMGVKVPGWSLVWLGETAGWVSDKHLRLLVD